ncbi:hypothetical protein H4R18_004219 [Coemansia javaensis]|uniref:Pentatricopeptide repeat-containing protein n=1 Tax=Coemansia javaensis TaxID=2761396 RepID=A0A9W8H9P2_9FUNG|nr:hypothetical protein H4R18_004219 [Coemansia javaensis]
MDTSNNRRINAPASGRSNRRPATQVDSMSSRIQMLSLATQCRQYTTIRLPRAQGSLPVVPVTAVTLWARGMHTLLTFRPQDRVTSAVPLLKQRIAATQEQREQEVLRLAQRRDTLGRAIGAYREIACALPLGSRTPWVLLARCHALGLDGSDRRWLARSLCALDGCAALGDRELLLRAYLRLGEPLLLRRAVADLCVAPAPLGAATLAPVLDALQGTAPDRRLAARLWEALAALRAFAPSRECVRLALKAALHADRVALAIHTYRQVVAGRWAAVRPGYWIEKIMIYGLAINRHPLEALDVAAATTSRAQLATPAGAMQAAQKYELLLSGLSAARASAEAAEAAVAHVRDALGMRPTAAMYASLLGMLAWSRDWAVLERLLAQMQRDGHPVPDHVWRRILLGLSKQGRVDLCDRVLEIMRARAAPCTHAVALAAIQAFAQLGDLDMVLQWFEAIVAALQAHVQRPPHQQRAVGIGGTVAAAPLAAAAVDAPTSLRQPAAFAAYFIARNELVWHRSALAALIDVAGELGDAALVLRLWATLDAFRARVRTLRFSPHMYMTLARSLAWHAQLDRHHPLIVAWIRDPANAFSYCQRAEAEDFVRRCLRGDRTALRRARMRVRPESPPPPPPPQAQPPPPPQALLLGPKDAALAADPQPESIDGFPAAA